MEEMAVTMQHRKAHARLLTRVLPAVIQDDAENERVLAELERLDTLGRPLNSQEQRLAELLTLLVRHYEASRDPLGHANPIEALDVVMKERGVRQRDLIPVFGSSRARSRM